MAILLIFNVHGKLDADLFLVSFNIAESLVTTTYLDDLLPSTVISLSGQIPLWLHYIAGLGNAGSDSFPMQK